MLKKILELFEEGASFVGFFAVLLSGVAWLVIGLAKVYYYQEPFLYTVFPRPAAETYPLLIVAGVFAIELAYAALKSGIAGRIRPIVGMPWMAQRVFLTAVPILAAWIVLRPAAGASYVVPVMFVLFTGWCWHVSEWGFLSVRRSIERRERVGAAGSQGEDASPARLTHPKATFASIYGNDAIKKRLKEAAEAITAPRKDGSRPRNGILLHGAPGNGKTVFAEALAGELRLPLVTLTFADVASQWVGEKSARVRQAFEQAKRSQPCVLFIDEVDSFLEARDGRSDGVKEDRDLVNAMLTLMVDIRQCRVILVAATNHMDRLDGAGVREGRFDFKVEITPPDLPARIGLLRHGLKENVPGLAAPEEVVASVAQRWNGFSVKRILAVTEELASYAKSHQLQKLGFEDFMGALRQLQGQRGHVPEDVKPLADLVLSPNTRESLDLIVGRMADPEHTERLGGTLPSGVVFFGPPGTGKTAAAKGLAKEIGWAFLPATGAELARDPKRLEDLYRKAQDLRPAIIFVDEADELLRDRQYSGSTDATNKLLTLMDGVGDRVRDIVWVAATNHPDQIDAALLRGGRFTEKVEFELPSAADLESYVQQWLTRKNVSIEEGFFVQDLASLMAGSSIANADSVLQAALNRAIARRTMPLVMQQADVHRALAVVHGV